MGRFPSLKLNNDLIAISWSSKHKPPITDFNSTIRMKILKDGADYSSTFEVNDSFGDAERSKPTMFWLDDSTIISAWMGSGSLSINSQFDIYSQKVILNNTSLKKKFVSDKPLNDYSLSMTDANPQIIKPMSSENLLVIYTSLDENNNSKIMCSKINSELEILSNHILIELTNNDIPCSPKIFSTASGLVLIWTELNGASNDVYAQQFSEQFEPIGDKLLLNDFAANEYLEFSASMNNNNDIIVVWEAGNNLSAQRLIFDSGLTKLGSNFQLNKIQSNYSIYPCVRLVDNLIYTAWENQEGIWMNILDFDKPVSVEKTSAFPNNFMLFQNYPNPFNPTTTIAFVIPNVEAQNFVPVQLKVYDVLGREVATLVNEQKPAGSYEVKFDASDLSSGIYFYKLQTGSFAQTRKMILMK